MYNHQEFFSGIPSGDEDSRLFYFTEAQVGSASKMGLFGDFAPSVVFATNRFNGTNLPARESYLREFGYSKLCHLYCTLDKSVMFGFQNRYMARSKIHNLNSVAMILRRPDLLLDESLVKKEGISDDEVIKVLFEVKKNSTKLLAEVRADVCSSHTLEQREHHFVYPSALEKLVGINNLAGILLYGSSAKGEGNDFDNFCILKNLPADLYEKIKLSKPTESGREVGVIFIPEAFVDRFLYINVSNTLFRKNAKSLMGKFEIPIESQRYQIFKEMYHAGFGSAKLLSGMNLVYRRPDIFFDKPGLFEYFMKLNRFTLQGLSQNKGYIPLEKGEVLSRLKEEFDFEIPKFRADSAYLQESFLKANKASVELARKLYDSSLAREEGESLLNIEKQLARRIFLGRQNGSAVYIFGNSDTTGIGNVVPVKILDRTDREYEKKRKELHYRGISSKENFLIGRRV